MLSDSFKALFRSIRSGKRFPGLQAIRVKRPQPRTEPHADEFVAQVPLADSCASAYVEDIHDRTERIIAQTIANLKLHPPQDIDIDSIQQEQYELTIPPHENWISRHFHAILKVIVAQLCRTSTQAAFLGLFFASPWPVVMSVADFSPAQMWGVDTNLISATLATDVLGNKYPSNTTIQAPNQSYAAVMQYGFDPKAQAAAEKIINRHRPDYAAFVAIDPKTGRVLSMVSKTRDNNYDGNLAIRGTFPAASVFKIVTAAAALDTGVITADSITPYNGKTTTLYKSQVLRHKENKWTRKPTLRESFAKSTNAVFARVGIYQVGAQNLREYAERFGFNRVLLGDFPFDSGRVGGALDTDWSIAQTASGFTRKNTLSPLHGALIAATALNNGVMPSPYLVEKITDNFGITLYSVDQSEGQRVVSENTAMQLRILMRETVKKGSARKSFKDFFKGEMAHADVGGKTGSLTGLNPRGRYDWFVGYGKLGDKEIAYAALCINIEKWYVKSAYIARKVLESYLP